MTTNSFDHTSSHYHYIRGDAYIGFDIIEGLGVFITILLVKKTLLIMDHD